jgi:indolepyruvate decarboxylase
VLNNSGYLIERLLCQNRDFGYNEIASSRYSELPHALGCDGWYTARATNPVELDQSLNAEGKTGGSTLRL